MRELPYIGGALGLAAFIGGRLTWIDAFDSPEMCLKLWKKLVSSYALDAVDDGESEVPAPPGFGEEVRELLRAPESARLATFDSPGLGTDVRLDGETSRGAALIVEDRVVHLGLFRADPVIDRDWTPITRPSRRIR